LSSILAHCDPPLSEAINFFGAGAGAVKTGDSPGQKNLIAEENFA